MKTASVPLKILFFTRRINVLATSSSVTTGSKLPSLRYPLPLSSDGSSGKEKFNSESSSEEIEGYFEREDMPNTACFSLLFCGCSHRKVSR